jgi:hypothetical protein
MDEDMFRCPICDYPTLSERGGYEICQLCNWEDDGTDELDSYSGPNGDYTVREARQNFCEHVTMYRPAHHTGFEMSRRSNHIKRVYMALIDAYRVERSARPLKNNARARVLWKGAFFALRRL